MSERFAGRFRLVRPLGKGGMGEVFLARDLASGAECALKRLTLATDLLPPDALAHEFEAVTRVRHPAVVAVYEFGFAPEGTPYYTMEYVPGRPADAAVARGDIASLCFVAARIADGLEALHAAGVFHGDLKPSNVLVVPGAAPGAPPASVRLLDFGLAALRGGERRGHRGTPGYAAPEIVRGEAPGVATDLYGFGSTLYTLIAGRPAFEAGDAGSLLRRQQSGPPPASPLEEAGAPAALVQLVLRLLAPSPAERPRDAREARRELERIHPAARQPLAARLDGVSLVGRERELARLGPGVARRARLVLLAGDAGAGKSVLLDAVAVRAALAGQWVVRLSCAGSEGAGSAARALLRRLAAGALVDPEQEAADSPVRRFLDGAGVISESDLGSAVEAAASWIRVIAQRAGEAVVLLDDLESLDAVSRGLLRRLVLHPGTTGARWVWAGRPASGDAAEEERMLVEAGVADRIPLGPLDDAAVASLAAARLGEPAPRALTEFLWARAGGHPGLTVELLRAAAAAGAIREDDDGLHVDATALGRLAAPADFEDTLLARFRALAEGPRSAAIALATWGRPVAPERLGTLDARAGAEALEALERTGLAARDEAGLARLSPPALATRVLDTLDPETRRELHRRILRDSSLAPAERFAHLRAIGDVRAALDAAEIAFAAAPDETLAIEAASLAESEEPARAADWYERAAKALSDRGRYAAAIPYLERALELDRSSDARPRRWYRLSNATYHAGSASTLEQILGRANSETLPTKWRALLLTDRAAHLRLSRDLDGALTAAREALSLAEQSGDSEALGIASHDVGIVLLALKRFPEAAEHVRRAAEIHLANDHKLRYVRALNVQAVTAHLQQAPVEAEALFRRALAISRAAGLRSAGEEVLSNLASLLTSLGRWAEARDACEEAARIALEDGHPVSASLAVTNLAQHDGLTGRSREARRNAIAGVRLSAAHNPRLAAYTQRTFAQACRIAGRAGPALRAAHRAVQLARRGATPEELEWGAIELGRLQSATGRWREARKGWEAALQGRRAGGSVAFTILSIFAGRALIRDGDVGGAAKLLVEAKGWLEGRTAPYAGAFADQLAAEIALAESRTDEAIALAERALEGFAALPAPWDRAMAALDFARLAMDQGRQARTPVAEWLDLAASTFERLGDHPNRERALALLVRWLRRAGLQPTVIGPDRNLIEGVSRLLNSLADLRELTQRAMRMAVEQLDAQRGVLLLVDAETGQLTPIAEYGAVDATTRSDAVGFSRRVVQRVTEGGGSLLIQDAPTDPRSLSESMVDMRLRSIVCVPMFLRGRVIGAVYLDDARRPEVFGDAERGLLEGFAQLMAVAIENSQGQEEIRRANQELVDENLELRQEMGRRFQPQNIVGSSTLMQRILTVAQRAAQTNASVLLTGENGTGKEMLARVIHHSSPRRARPFVAVNCGAIPEPLIEAELFGILSNVATDVKGRDGRFVMANGGTLFLDEIGEMPPDQQVRLLSALTNREITPVGGGKPILVDVRIIAATNRDLTKAIAEGKFREDLFYRLNVIPIEVPPLRDRKADIPALGHFFVAHFAEQQQRGVPEMAPEFLAALMQSDWPGNVRQLQNYIERILAMSPGPILYPDPLPQDLEARGAIPRVGRGHKLSEVVSKLEKKLVSDALERARGNQSLAARELGMTEQSIRYKIRKYGLTPREELRYRRIQR